MTRLAAVCGVALAFGLGACGERAQTMTAGAERKSDTQGWQVSNSVHLAPGWTPGDKASWEAQLRNRAQAQNDFAPAAK